MKRPIITLISTCFTTLYLSHAPIQAQQDGLTHEPDTITDTEQPRPIDNNPFSGASDISMDLAKDQEDFETPKEPVPYLEPWDNELRQTAQQYVAIVSMIERESGDPGAVVFRNLERREAQLRTERDKVRIVEPDEFNEIDKRLATDNLVDLVLLGVIGFGLLLAGMFYRRRSS